jgi:hypothetical protein
MQLAELANGNSYLSVKPDVNPQSGEQPAWNPLQFVGK